jgi:MerR family redox-sensitive transcriptional activator SoxR
MPASSDRLTIGELSQRSGVAASALRFYEAEGLIEAERTETNHRRFKRATLRRVAAIRAAQAVGLSLAQIKEAFATLARRRTPTTADWERLSTTWRAGLDEHIAYLERLRDELSGCIGCGCLSLESCGLLNFGDHVAALGPGARFLLGDAKPG